MKSSLKFYALLSLSIFAASTAIAQQENSTENEDAIVVKTAPVNLESGGRMADINTAGIPTFTLSDTVAGDDNISQPVIITSINAYPNPNRGLLSIKTECAGKVYFYSQRGVEKAECMVHEGTNLIYLSSGLAPGIYTCRFRGVNGTRAEQQVMYGYSYAGR